MFTNPLAVPNLSICHPRAPFLSHANRRCFYLICFSEPLSEPPLNNPVLNRLAAHRILTLPTSPKPALSATATTHPSGRIQITFGENLHNML